MSAPSKIRSAWARELRRERLDRFGLALGTGLRGGGMLVLAGMGAAWAMGWDLFVVLGLGWLTVGLIAGGIAILRAPPPRAARHRLAAAWDARYRARGALLAATHLINGCEETRLAPLVLEAAARRIKSDSPESLTAPSTRALLTALGLVFATLLLVIIPFPGPAAVRAAIRGDRGDAARLDGEGSGLRGGAGTASDPGTPPMDGLGDLVSLEISTDRTAYILEEEIQVTAVVRTRGLLERELELEARLGIADGLPFPDQGLGVGFRPVGFPGTIRVPRAPGSAVDKTVRILGALKSWKIYKPGLYTLEARAISVSPGSKGLGAVVSNRITIQVSENRERIRYRQPTPTRKQKQKDAPRKRKDPAKRPEGKGGKDALKLGEPDRLPNVKRLAHAVKPLLSDAPTVEKEVEVFERERGGKIKPLPGRTENSAKGTRPDLTRRPESAIPRLTFSPLERRLIRRYFAILNRDF